jgi:hypothetical protein
MRQISRRGQRQGPPRRFLMSLYARYGTVLRNPPRSRGVGDRRSFPWPRPAPYTLRSSPRKRGPRGQALECLQVWAPASAGASGNCCSVRRHYSVVKERGAIERIADRQKEISPCLHAPGQGIALIPSFSPPSRRGGMARRQGAVPRLLQADVRQRPDHGAQRCTRALRRANGHLRLTPRQRSDRPGAICPWEVSPSVARGSVCVIANPQVPSRSPPCERLRKAPLELGSG